jgi:hypothetical protein
MSWSQAIITFFVDAFRPPFRNAPWIAVLYAVLCVIYSPDSQFSHWALPDTDDYMRFNQMFNWLHGQSWFDMSMPRLYPQHVINMHWARLPDVPLAAVFLVLEQLAHFFQLKASQQDVALLTAFFVPIALMCGLMYLMSHMARPLLSRSRANLACFTILLCGQLIFQFLPMRVDHHAYILLCAGTAFFALQLIAIHVRPTLMALIAGIALAIGMWNGAEILPMLVLFCAAFTILAILDNRVLLASALFGASLLAANFILLFIARAPGDYWAIEFDAFSFFYVLLAALVAGFFATFYGVSLLTRNKAILLAAAGFIALCGSWLLLSKFPTFIEGPYAQVNPLLNSLFFPNIREAIPLYKSWADIANNFTITPGKSVGAAFYYFGTRIFLPGCGIFISLYMAIWGKVGFRERKLWALFAFFAASFTMLAMFWQVRVITYAQLVSGIPLTWMVLNYLKTLPKHYSGRKLFAYEILVVFMLTLFPTIVMPAILGQSKFMPDMLFFLGKGVDSVCRNRMQINAYLQDLAVRKKKNFTIMAPMDYTPELMFYTPHNFIAAPYHRNDRGIIDMTTFFRSSPPNDEAAKAIARKLDIDYVLVCKDSPFQGTLSKGGEIKSVAVSYKNQTITSEPDPKDVKKGSLGLRLTKGTPPAWLETRDVPLEVDFKLFEVKKNMLGKPRNPTPGRSSPNPRSE